MLLHDPSDIDPNACKFTFGAKAFDVNDPDPRSNVVWALGYNMQPGNGRLDPSDAALGLVFESYYVAAGRPSNEFHLSAWDTDGNEHRVISGVFPRDGGEGSGLLLSADRLTLSQYNGTVNLQYNLATGNVNHIGVFQYIFDTNNFAFLRQRNAANTTWLSLPYIDNSDRLEVDSVMHVTSLIPARPVFTDASKNLVSGPAGFTGSIDVGGTVLNVTNGIITEVI